MAIVNENKSHNNITAGKVLVTAGLSCVPIISITGDLLDRTIKNHRIDKTPVKDCFVKAVRQSGEKVQALFSSLKKFSSLKVGIAATTLLTIIDVSFLYWCVDKIAEKLNKNK